jgi:putative flippase GtrA
VSYPDLSRVLRFILVGVSSTALYFSLLWVLRNWIPNIIALTALCYLASMIYNCVVQSFFTFRTGRPTTRILVRFGMMHLLALGLNSGLMHGLVSGLGIAMFVAQIAVTLLISMMVFLISKHWVFARQEQLTQHAVAPSN